MYSDPNYLLKVQNSDYGYDLDTGQILLCNSNCSDKKKLETELAHGMH